MGLGACGGGGKEKTGSGGGGQPTATAGSQGEQPAGGGEPARTEADLVAADGRLRPSSVAVAEGLPVRLVVRSGDGAAHSVTVRGSRTLRLSVPAGGSARAKLPALHGQEQVSVVDARGGRATLRVLAAPGP